MSARVLKWSVPADDKWHPVGAGPVMLVAVQSPQDDLDLSPVGVVTVWTLETAPDPEYVPAQVFGTGHSIPGSAHLEHAGSCLDRGLVWHVFRGNTKPRRYPVG